MLKIFSEITCNSCFSAEKKREENFKRERQTKRTNAACSPVGSLVIRSLKAKLYRGFD